MQLPKRIWKNSVSEWGDYLKINDRPIENMEAILNSFVYSSSNIERNIYDAGLHHIVLSQNITAQNRELTVTFESERAISEFTSLLLSKDLTIDTEDGYLYDCILTKAPNINHIGRDYYSCTYELSAIKKGHKQIIKLSYQKTKAKIIGTYPVMPVITITPNRNMNTFMLNEYKIKNLKKDKPIIIDSVCKLIQQEGMNKFSDVEFKKWPVLQTGVNTFTLSSDGADVTIEYHPIYL